MKIIWAVAATVVLLMPHMSSAHVLQTDGSIGAVLHIDPNDNPVAQQPAEFFFEISDKANRFTPAQCDCSVKINNNGKKLFSAKLSSSNNTSPQFQYTFPAKGVYTVVLSGTPQAVGAFQSFSLSYDIRVETQAPVAVAVASTDRHGWQIILFGAVFVFFLGKFMYDRSKAKRLSFKGISKNSIVGLLFLFLAVGLLAQCLPQHSVACSTDCILPVQYSVHAADVATIAPRISTQTYMQFAGAVVYKHISLVSVLSSKVNNKSPPIV